LNEINENKENKNTKFDENSNKIKTESPPDLILEKQLDITPIGDELRIFHRNQIEASLYIAGRPLNVEELSTKLEISKKEVEELIKELAFDYLERSTALVVNQVGEKYQMTLKSEYIEKVTKFAKGGAIADKYLRTLTIIALKQPILKSLVIKIRGSGAYEHIKYLIDNSLINAVQKGKSQELNTTDKYSEMFGLPKDVEEMKKVMINQLGIEKEDDIKKQD
jgi:segregation and condensation protein B